MADIQFLGTGTPNPDPKRQGNSLVVFAADGPIIVDCGPGLVRQAAAAGIEMSSLTRAFLTHLHSDHSVGLPDLILTPAVTGRLTPLKLWGPPGTRRMTNALLEAYSEDIETRIHGEEPAVLEAYDVEVVELEEGDQVDEAGARVTAFRVSHGSWKHAFGYRFDVGGKSIVISGDTTPNANLVTQAHGCDVLVHEVCSERGLAKRTSEWQDYHRAFHTTGIQLGQLAATVQPKLLLLYHLLPFGEPEEQILEEVREHFTGNVAIPRDLEAYTIG